MTQMKEAKYDKPAIDINYVLLWNLEALETMLLSMKIKKKC